MVSLRLVVVSLLLSCAAMLPAACSDTGSDDAPGDAALDVASEVGTDALVSEDATVSDTSSDMVSGEVDDDVALLDVTTEGDSSASDAIGDTTTPPMPTALCGMAGYDLLPASEVGGVVSWEPMAFWTMDKATAEALLAAAGLDFLALEHDFAMYRYRYVTQDRGVLVEATGTLAIPTGEGIEEGQALPVMLNVHGTTGWSDPCSISGDVLSQSNALGALPAALGYITVTPDYIGLAGYGGASTAHHAYMHGEQVAIGVWDSLRAAQGLLDTELGAPVTMSGSTVIVGASQGGHGALFVERYGPYYAPEYPVTAVVAQVPPGDLFYATSFFGADGTLSTAGILAIILVTQSQWYGQGDLADLLLDGAPEHYASTFVEAIYDEASCPLGTYPSPSLTGFDGIFAASFLDGLAGDPWDAPEPWRCFLRENSITTTSVPPLRQVPTLMVFGTEDQLVPPSGQLATFQTLCDEGAQLEYLLCEGTSHTEAVFASLPEQLAWLDARLAGEPLDEASTCVVTAPTTCTGSQ